MRIAFIGAQNVGKTTLMNDFMKNWPNYKVADNSYREQAKADPKIKLNQNGDEEAQRRIQGALCDQIIAHQNEDNVLFDRCILDNLVYSIWLNEKDNVNVTDLFIEKSLILTKETLKMYDILFFMPILEKYPIEIVPDEDRDTDPNFRAEIDNIFKAVVNSYHQGRRTFFPNEDCPAIIEIFGSPEERIQMIKLYLNESGSAFGEEDSLLQDID